ncbi:dTDP-4-dehydrorhamnose 3,5-epimerase [Desulfocucumis palustris]|uniref:dTDP-4-dehydrorhamnose 3,5-epimerase n=1 Tax=Desulfocucumis palustris TaxID=1898651 RepID=A0A2L2XBE5_9FIRM|nr:dTDP-4-dehydrorhamnose 3,5-epimerase [Desulfocucumis palustris]GBF33430.1 dTDP-4-dehydrorhamnose 3,5-epimerase [Desulfocucumis palustris]
MIKAVKTTLEGVIKIIPDSFEDFRGCYVEIYNKDLYKARGVEADFIQDDISVSSKHVLRGIHGDNETWKLVSCLLGRFYLVVVNCDEQSAGFGQWESFVLSETNRHQILIPPGFGNAHVVLSDQAIFHYKQSTYYNPSGQFTYKWDDPRLNIWWPVKNPLLSQRDETGKLV